MRKKLKRHRCTPIPGFRCDHCGERSRVKPLKKKVKDLDGKVREYLLRIVAKRKLPFFTKEEISFHFETPQHYVAQVLHKLNLEGLVTQRENEYPHDGRRNKGLFWGVDNNWSGSSYYLNKEKI